MKSSNVQLGNILGGQIVENRKRHKVEMILDLEHGISGPSPLLALLQLLLGFAELGQVERGDLLGVLDLLLVGLDLALQLGCKVGHPVLVLFVLVVLEKNLLDSALRLLEGLLVLSSLGLQVAQPLLEQQINS